VDANKEMTMTTKYIVSGTTFDLRDQLRAAGAHYDGTSKTWSMDEAAYDKLRTIVGRIASPTGNSKARAYERAWDGLVIEEVA
jgi:hypothetical protein